MFLLVVDVVLFTGCWRPSTILPIMWNPPGRCMRHACILQIKKWRLWCGHAETKHPDTSQAYIIIRQ
jgi:hypothetical protein